MEQILGALPLDFATPQIFTMPLGRMIIVPKAGADLSGSITLFGNGVDKETGVVTPATAEILSFLAAAADASSNDGDGHNVWDITGARISTNWYTGLCAITTTDIVWSDFDLYVCPEERFNFKGEVNFESWEVRFRPEAATTYNSGYLYHLEVDPFSSLATIKTIAGFRMANPITRTHMIRRVINKSLDGRVDTVWEEFFETAGKTANLRSQFWVDVPTSGVPAPSSSGSGTTTGGGVTLGMSAGDALTPKPTDQLTRPRKLFNKNLSSLNQDTDKQKILELQSVVKELQAAVEQLQRSDMTATEVDSTGLPEHGQSCDSLNGQYLRLTSQGSGLTIAVAHGLGRVPQGCIWTKAASANDILIEGDTNVIPSIPVASSDIVHFRLNGPQGEESIVILI